MDEDQLRKAFNSIDENGDGHITKWELKKAIEKTGLNPSLQECDWVIRQVDLNKNETIEFDEFGKLWELINSNAAAELFGGKQKLLKKRMEDVGKYPTPPAKWKRKAASTSHGMYNRKEGAGGPPKPKTFSQLP